MTQEDKELLLQDLSSRLPYKVIVDYGYNAFDVHNGNYVKHGSKCILNCYLLDVFISPRQNEKGEYIKPYLRPMSSMTEEEMEELKTLCSIYIPTDSPTIGFEDYGIIVFTHHLTNNTYSFKLNIDVIDWLNLRHFDYRGLIEKGLAIAITEENNPYKE